MWAQGKLAPCGNPGGSRALRAPCLALPLGHHAGRGRGLRRDAGAGGYLGRLQMMLSPQASFHHPALTGDTHLPGPTDDHAHPMARAAPQKAGWSPPQLACSNGHHQGQFWGHVVDFTPTPRSYCRCPHLGRGGAAHDAGEHSDHVDRNGICVLVQHLGVGRGSEKRQEPGRRPWHHPAIKGA